MLTGDRQSFRKKQRRTAGGLAEGNSLVELVPGGKFHTVVISRRLLILPFNILAIVPQGAKKRHPPPYIFMESLEALILD